MILLWLRLASPWMDRIQTGFSVINEIIQGWVTNIRVLAHYFCPLKNDQKFAQERVISKVSLRSIQIFGHYRGHKRNNFFTRLSYLIGYWSLRLLVQLTLICWQRLRFVHIQVLCYSFNQLICYSIISPPSFKQY